MKLLLYTAMALFFVCLGSGCSARDASERQLFYCKNLDEVMGKETVVDDAGTGDAGARDAGVDAGAREGVLDDLFCVSWATLGSDAVEILLTNYWATCAGPFEALSQVEKRTQVDITIIKSDCRTSTPGCYCPYDIPVVIRDVFTGGVLNLAVHRYSCQTRRSECKETVTLPVGERPEGRVCQYMGTTDGERHGFCAGGSAANASRCAGNLVCQESNTLTGPREVCLMPCDDETPCPHADLFECRDRACHVTGDMVQTCLGQ